MLHFVMLLLHAVVVGIIGGDFAMAMQLLPLLLLTLLP
jgi:nitrate/nitrite transporter NarK